MNTYITLYLHNEFLPKYMSDCRNIFYLINLYKYDIQKWEDIVTNIDMNNTKEFDLYTRYLINQQVDFNTIIQTHFYKELQDYILNCSDKIYLYQQCKKFLLNINNILLFVEFNKNLFLDQINIHYNIFHDFLQNIENITEHIMYHIEIGKICIEIIKNNLYEYYLFNCQSDIPGNKMFQLPVLNKYNIQSRNNVIREPLSINFLYGIDEMNKLKNSLMFNIYKSNSKNLLSLLNQCIDDMYTKDTNLPGNLNFTLIPQDPNIDIINIVQRISTRINTTPIKTPNVQLLNSRLSTPQKNYNPSPHQRIIHNNIQQQQHHINSIYESLKERPQNDTHEINSN